MLLKGGLAQEMPFSCEQMGQLFHELTNQCERSITAAGSRRQ